MKLVRIIQGNDENKLLLTRTKLGQKKLKERETKVSEKIDPKLDSL